MFLTRPGAHTGGGAGRCGRAEVGVLVSLGEELNLFGLDWRLELDWGRLHHVAREKRDGEAVLKGNLDATDADIRLVQVHQRATSAYV